MDILADADGVNLLGDNVNTINENRETNEEIGLELNAKKTKYLLMSFHQKS
jgi:hypothetical protein